MDKQIELILSLLHNENCEHLNKFYYIPKKVHSFLYRPLYSDTISFIQKRSALWGNNYVIKPGIKEYSSFAYKAIDKYGEIVANGSTDSKRGLIIDYDDDSLLKKIRVYFPNGNLWRLDSFDNNDESGSFCYIQNYVVNNYWQKWSFNKKKQPSLIEVTNSDNDLKKEIEITYSTGNKIKHVSERLLSPLLKRIFNHKIENGENFLKIRSTEKKETGKSYTTFYEATNSDIKNVRNWTIFNDSRTLIQSKNYVLSDDGFEIVRRNGDLSGSIVSEFVRVFQKQDSSTINEIWKSNGITKRKIKWKFYENTISVTWNNWREEYYFKENLIEKVIVFHREIPQHIYLVKMK